MLQRLGPVLVHAAAVGMTLLTAQLSRPDPGQAAFFPARLAGLVALYLAALLFSRRASLRSGWVLALGLLMRLPPLAAPPVLSDDVYRYVWDGGVSRAGHNPFRYAPRDTALMELRNPDWQRINHPELRTIYPPAAQAFFHLGARVAPGVTGLKCLLVACDLAVALLLAGRLAGRPAGPRRLLLYWWHPLPVLEFAGSGHADVLGILFLFLAFLLAEGGPEGAAPPAGRGRAWPGLRALPGTVARGAGIGLCLAGAGLVKFLALAAAPFVAGRRWLAASLTFLLLTLLAYLPFIEPGVNPLGSLHVYAAKWRANDFIFAFLLPPGTPEDLDLRLTRAKLHAAAIVVVVMAVSALLRAPRAAAVPAVVGTALIVSPTVHPWYFTWLLPFLAIRFSGPWFYLSLAVLVGYHPLPDFWSGRGWHETGWLKAAAFGPFLVLALHSAWKLVRSAGGRGAQAGPGDVR